MTRVPPLRQNTRFQLLWSGSLVSTLGTSVAHLAYPLLVLAMTGSPSRAGLVAAVDLAAMVALSLPAGVLVDRCDRRRILLGCEAVRLLGALSVAAAALAGRVVLPHLLVVAALTGAAGAVFGPARMIAVRGVVPGEQLPSALAQEESRTHVASLLGPPLGGVLFGLGRWVPFLADAVSYLVSLCCILGARVPRRPNTNASEGPASRALGEAARWLWRRPFLRAVLALGFFANVLWGAVMLPVVVLVDARGGSALAVGLATGGIGAGGLLGALLAARIHRLLPPGMLVVAIVGWVGVFTAVVALPLGVYWPGVALTGCAVVMPAIEVMLGVQMLDGVPGHMQGRVLGLVGLASGGLAPLGPLLGGTLAQVAGPATALVTIAVFLVTLAAAGLLSPALRRGPDHVATDQPRPEPLPAA